MATKLLSIDELDRRHVAAWEEYLRDHAPDNTRCQVFTGGGDVTDRRRAYHIEMAALDNKAFGFGFGTSSVHRHVPVPGAHVPVCCRCAMCMCHVATGIRVDRDRSRRGGWQVAQLREINKRLWLWVCLARPLFTRYAGRCATSLLLLLSACFFILSACLGPRSALSNSTEEDG